jgi:hypothetical protein
MVFYIIMLIIFACLIFASVLVVKHKSKINRNIFLALIIVVAIYIGAVGRFYVSPLLWRLHSTPTPNQGERTAFFPPPGAVNELKVIPINHPDVVAGQIIVPGYEVGKSIIYPGCGGYSVLANPSLNWTADSKSAYVNTRQARKDLNAFLGSVYANSATFGVDGSGMPLTSGNHPLVNRARLGVYYFRSISYFPVSGDVQGGVMEDESAIGSESGIAFGTKLDFPYKYVIWYASTDVYDLAHNVVSVDLSLSWTFSSIPFTYPCVSHPSSIASNGSRYSWSSGPQQTWYYAFIAPRGIISSLSTFRSQIGTSYSNQGTVNVRGNGGVSGFAGVHYEGYDSKGIWGDK